MQTLKFLSTFSGHSNWIHKARFSPDVRLLCSASEDKKIIIWDLSTTSKICILSDFDEKVQAAEFHPDGTCVGGAGKDGKVRIWDLRTEKMVQFYDGGEKAINDLK